VLHFRSISPDMERILRSPCVIAISCTRDVASGLFSSAEADPAIRLCVPFYGAEVSTPRFFALHIVIAKSNDIAYKILSATEVAVPVRVQICIGILGPRLQSRNRHRSSYSLTIVKICFAGSCSRMHSHRGRWEREEMESKSPSTEEQGL
jgi:hypothetical protein